MSVSTPHPDYSDCLGEWRLMRDAVRGESAIKAAGEEYLPLPSGFSGPSAAEYYATYMARAQFPEVTEPTITGMVGVIHRTETQIELPKSMVGLWERATRDGTPLEALHARVTAELLTTGRYGLLVGASSAGSELPYLVGYTAESIINWSEDGTFFVLDESGMERRGFIWHQVQRHRVLTLDGGVYAASIYRSGDGQPEQITPTMRGAAPMKEIPFVVIGAQEVDIAPSPAPLIGVARSAKAQYQLSADYRWQLYMSGQETLVIINGGEDPDIPAVGAGAMISLQGVAGQTPDAKYVGPAGTGIAAHRQALADEREAAARAGAKLFQSEGGAQESGEARRIRYAAQTATLVTVAQSSAKGLEKALRHTAVMIGANPEEVIVRPNLSFMDSTLSPADALDVIRGWQEGGYSFRTMYERLQRGEAVSGERDADEEFALIDNEEFRPSRADGLSPGE